MDKLYQNTNIIFLIFVKECFNLKFRFTKNIELYRKKLITSITIVERDNDEYRSQIKFYIKISKLKLLHRENGPAEITFINGVIDEVYWNKYGKMHRDNGPAKIWFHKDKLWLLEWHNNGKLHRIEKPAWVRFDKDIIVDRHWFLYGKQHFLLK